MTNQSPIMAHMVVHFRHPSCTNYLNWLTYSTRIPIIEIFLCPLSRVQTPLVVCAGVSRASMDVVSIDNIRCKAGIICLLWRLFASIGGKWGLYAEPITCPITLNARCGYGGQNAFKMATLLVPSDLVSTFNDASKTMWVCLGHL